MLRPALALLALAPLAAGAQQIVPAEAGPTRPRAEAQRPADLRAIEPAEQVPTLRGALPAGFEGVRLFPTEALRAGDVNGDGRADVVYRRSNVADPTTPDLSDAPGQTLLFFGPATSPAPSQVVAAVLVPVGDVDGDGLSDAYASVEGGTVLYRGSAAGYVRAGEVRVGGQPVVIEGLEDPSRTRGFGDVDGDGRADLVTKRGRVGGPLQVEVLLGAGGLAPLSFQGGLNVEFPLYPYVVADTDGDGRDEVVFVEESVERSSGAITRLVYAASYSAEGTFSVREFARVSGARADGFDFRQAFELADLDADGDLDLRFGSSTIAGVVGIAFKNNGGAFDPAPYRDGLGRLAGDLDGDGSPDGVEVRRGAPLVADVGFGPAAFSDSQAGRVVAHARSAQPFAESTVGDELAATTPFLSTGAGYRVGDLDGDGRDDSLVAVDAFERGEVIGFGRVLVSADAQNTTAQVVAYDGRQFPVASVRSTAGLGDVSGDGVDDFAVVYQDRSFDSGPRIEVFFGGRPATDGPALVLRRPESVPFPETDRRFGEVVGVDFDGDGTNDIVAGFYGAPGTPGDPDPLGGALVWFGGADLDATVDWYYRCQGVECQVSGAFSGVFNVAPGDFNGDGTTDVAVAGRQPVALLGGARPASSPSRLPESRVVSPLNSATSIEARRLHGLGDVDGDGSDDLLVCNPFVECRVVRGGAQLFQGPGVVLEGEGFVRGITSTHGDFDGDGVPDVAVVNLNSGSAPILDVFYGGAGLGTGVPDVRSDVVAALFGPESFLGEVTGLPDVDGDGDDEILVANGSLGRPFGAYVIAGGTFTPLASLASPNTGVGIGVDNNNILNDLHSAVGDFDGDEVTDVILAQQRDTNDGPVASRVYRYRLGLVNPVATEGASGRFGVVVGPNPARSMLRTVVELTEAAEVTVDVVDVLGRHVARAQQTLAAGPGRIDVDVSDLASGTYVVRVRAGSEVSARVITVAR